MRSSTASWASATSTNTAYTGLVAAAFHPEGWCDGRDVVNHKNGVRSDNRACNLEWTTHEEPSRREHQPACFHFGALILQAVVGPPGLGETCDHINRARGDNRLSNLWWASAAAQRANQGPPAVVGIDADGLRTEYTTAEQAASGIYREVTHSVKTVAAHIRVAINDGTEAYGSVWERASQGRHRYRACR